MNIKDLKYFTKLVELKSYSDTAHFFNVSQPTISYAIKRLEEEYNTELIIRKSFANSITLTVSGQQFLIHANKILREDELNKKDLSRISQGKIKMGFPPIISDAIVPLAFDQLHDQKLLDKIEPVRSGSKELLQEVHKGNIDISLIATTRFPQDGEFDYDVIKAQKFKIIASSKRNFPKELRIKDLQSEDVIVLDQSSVHQLIVNNLIEKYSVFTNIIYQTADYKLLLNLVKENKGISVITETALKDMTGIQELNVVDIDFPLFYSMLVYRSSIVKDRDIEKIIKIFSDLPK